MPEAAKQRRLDDRRASVTMVRLVNDRVDNPEESGVRALRRPRAPRRRRSCASAAGATSPTVPTSTKLRFQPGHVLFGKRRAYQRKVAVADFEGICSGDIDGASSRRPNVLLPEFLPFFMQTDAFMEHARRDSVGSLSPTINWTTLAADEFALPPIEEQRRMVGVLMAADGARRSAAQLARALRRLSTSCARRTLTRVAANVELRSRTDVRASLRIGRSSRLSRSAAPTLSWRDGLLRRRRYRGYRRECEMTASRSTDTLDDVAISRCRARA